MKASLPYVYEIDHQYETAAKAVLPQIGVMDVELPEISWSEVNILATWSAKDVVGNFGQKLSLFRWNGEQYLTTSAEGRLVTAEDLPNDEKRQALDLAKIEELYRGSETNFNQQLLFLKFLDGERRMFAKPRKGSTLSSTEAASSQGVSVMANGMVIVGGVVCQKVQRVHIRLPEPWLTAVEIDYTKNGGRTWHARGLAANPVRLSLNDENAVDLFIQPELATYRGFGNLSVIDVEAVDFDGRREYTTRLMSRIMYHTGSSVGDWNAALIRQWAQIKEAQDQLPIGGDVADAIELARQFSEDCPHPQVKNEVAIAMESLDRFDQMSRYQNSAKVQGMKP
jgi:hypothetical protein